MNSKPNSQSMPATLLLVAYAFPPENLSGAARPYRFFRYLPEQGIAPVVVTATPQPIARKDIVVVRDDAREYPRTSWSWQFERIIRKTILPGEEGLTWSRKAASACATIVPPLGRTVILSTSPPFSVHLAAMKAKRRTGIPWIADFRDPMNVGEANSLNIHHRFESYFFRRADAIIANTDTAAVSYERRHPLCRDKMTVIWNGFDPADAIGAAPLPVRNYKQVSHVGEVYAGRHPGPILRSIKRLVERRLLDPRLLRLSLIGPANEEEIPDLELLRELVACGIVDYVPTRIPQDEARRIASTSDGLLLLQPQSATQVPAKLFEYIRIGRPILAYLPRNSPSERIMALSGIRFRVIYPEDSLEQVDATVLQFLALPNDPVKPSDTFDQQFDARNHAKTLATLVHRLLGVQVDGSA